jgi:hypothetical protein
MRNNKEHELQLECIAIGRNLQNVIVIPVPNEAAYKNRNIVVHNGVSDLIVCIPNEIYFTELKTPTGTQRKDQIKFQKDIESLGLEYYIIRSKEEFQQLLYQKLGI